MNLIRYQNPELVSWPSLDRWTSLRDDLNSLFESPFWPSLGRAGQLFSALVAGTRSLSEQRQCRRRSRTARDAQGRHRNFFARRDVDDQRRAKARDFEQ